MSEQTTTHIWFYQRQTMLNPVEEGPFDEKQMLQLAKAGTFSLGTAIRSPTRTKNQWMKLEQVSALALVVNQAKIDEDAKKRAAADEKRARKEELAAAKQLAKAEAEKARALERQSVATQESSPAAGIPDAKVSIGSSTEGRHGQLLQKSTNEETLFDGHPAMFKNDPIRFVVYCVLCLLLVGIPLLIVWWLTCKAERLTITTLKSVQRKGLFSKHTTEVWHRDVRNVQVHQSFFQRILGVGRISVSSAGQGGLEIDFAGISNPDQVKKIIDGQRSN